MAPLFSACTRKSQKDVKKMKIGILTLHSQINYGGVLQAYALQKHLRDNGYDAEVIDYWLTPSNGDLLGFWLSASKPLWYRIIRFPYWCIRDGFVLAEIRRRRRTIRFIEQYISVGEKTYKTPQELTALSGYAVVIVGSDQIWHPVHIPAPNPFLLNWLREACDSETWIKRVSYAASFGVKEIPKERKDEYVSGLEKFDFISVREKEGREIVEDLLFPSKEKSENHVVRVLDPTLLILRSEWAELISNQRPQGSGDNAYVFCYWLGDIEKILPVLERLVSEGKKICFISNWRGGSWRKSVQNWKVKMVLTCTPGIRCCFAAGPKEFVKLVADSAAVLSDSFHAMMFGSIFEKPMCIVHKSSKTRVSMGARLLDFQKEYGLDGVVQEFVPSSEQIFVVPNYEIMKKKLAGARETSAEYLRNALTELN